MLGAGVAGYFYYFSNYPILTDSTDPSSFPHVSWRAITDGRVVRSIERQVVDGVLEAALPVLSFYATGDEFFDEVGVRFISISSDELKSGKYRAVETRPYRWVAFYQTTIAGERYYVLFQQWHNREGSVSYVPLILPERKVREGEGVSAYYEASVAEDSPYALSPILAYRDQTNCALNMGEAEYCAWMSKRADKYTAITEEWVERGSVPRAMGRYPASFSWTPLYDLNELEEEI